MEQDEFLGFIEESFNDEPEQLTMILEKEGLISLIASVIAEDGGMLFIYDTRDNQPKVGLFHSPEKAREALRNAIKVSNGRGWRVVFSGDKPLNDPQWG